MPNKDDANYGGLLGGYEAQYQQRPLGLADVFGDTPLMRIMSTLLNAPGAAISESIPEGLMQKLFGSAGGPAMTDVATNAALTMGGIPEETWANRIASEHKFDTPEAATSYENTPQYRLDRYYPQWAYTKGKLLPPRSIPREPTSVSRAAASKLEYDPMLAPMRMEPAGRALDLSMIRAATKHPALADSFRNIYVKVRPDAVRGQIATVLGYAPPRQGVTQVGNRFVATPQYEFGIKPGWLHAQDLNINPRIMTEAAKDRYFIGQEMQGHNMPGWEKLSQEEWMQSVLEHELHHAAQNQLSNRGLSTEPTTEEAEEGSAYDRQRDLLRYLISKATQPPQIPPEVQQYLKNPPFYNYPKK